MKRIHLMLAGAMLAAALVVGSAVTVMAAATPDTPPLFNLDATSPLDLTTVDCSLMVIAEVKTTFQAAKTNCNAQLKVASGRCFAPVPNSVIATPLASVSDAIECKPRHPPS